MDGTRVITERSAYDVLADCRSAVEPVLRATVGRLPESMRRIVGYHFGWYDEHGNACDVGAGKVIRPALVLLAAAAVSPGGPGETAIPHRRSGPDEAHDPRVVTAACALELVHNFSLLHDDVMDGDLTRRHRRTAWSVFGSGAAILAGDAALTLALESMAGSGHPAAHEATRMLSAAVQDLVDGQSADMSFERRSDVVLAECLDMAAGKTGALFGCACAVGALYGGGDPSQVDALRSFGTQLGLAFQCADDLLGIWGDPARTGKSVCSDVDSRKKSLPVVAALTSGTAAGRELAALYATDRTLDDAQLARAARLIDAAGGRRWADERAAESFADALRHLERAGPRPGPAAELAALARLMVARDR